MNVVEFKNVSKIFDGAVPVKALSNIDLTLPVGCFAALVGVSGSGKTTLLNLASGLDKPSTGEVWIAQQNITQVPEKSLSLFRREKLGFIFQSYNLFPTLTVIENVEYTMLIAGAPKKLARQRALESLDAVGLSDKKFTFPKNLSGGQQQRVAVARSLASNPQIILADEPTANLDHETAQLLIDLFRKLNQSQKVSFLFSTHDRELINSVQTVINIKGGRIMSVDQLNPELKI
jgi:putative ABC transport system ATP-binding protein